MRPRVSLFAALLVAALPARAETPLSAAEFESYVTGKTLYFEAAGITYGVEKYLKGRRVRWSFLDGACKEGHWYQSADQICFEYEDGTGPQCWQFFQGPGGLRARFQGNPPGAELYEADERDEPMLCLGPEVGV